MSFFYDSPKALETLRASLEAPEVRVWRVHDEDLLVGKGGDYPLFPLLETLQSCLCWLHSGLLRNRVQPVMLLLQKRNSSDTWETEYFGNIRH